MERAQFIKLGALSCLSVMVAGGQGNRLLGQSGLLGHASLSPLERWAARFRGALSSTSDGYQCSIRTNFNKMGPALDDLNQIVDGHLHCEGNVIHARFEGRELKLRIEIA